MELQLPESQPAKRRTIGYLGSTIEDGIARTLWLGIQEHCEANGVNLVSFIGRELESPGGFSRHSNMVYDMVDRDQVDGLIVWASSLSSYVGPEAIQRFCERYRPLPLVGIGMPIPGSPSIILALPDADALLMRGERLATIMLVADGVGGGAAG